MRRLAVVFAIIAALSTVEHIVLSGTRIGFTQARSQIRRALHKMTYWRAFLIGPLHLFPRTARASSEINGHFGLQSGNGNRNPGKIAGRYINGGFFRPKNVSYISRTSGIFQ
jgi:hypothetical protein